MCFLMRKSYAFRKLLICVIAMTGCFACGSSFSADISDASPEQFFIINYLSFCRPTDNNAALIAKLESSGLPEFPSQQAKLFLRNEDGHAWPLPYRGVLGNFVLALPSNKPVCFLFARRIDQRGVEQAFVDYATQRAPAGVVVAKRSDTTTPVTGGYVGHTIAYTWSLPGRDLKILMVLSTNPSPSADVQAFATVNLSRN